MTRRAWANSTRAARLPADWRSYRRPAVLERDGYRCQVDDLPDWGGCTQVADTVDHIRAGDDHSLTNLRAACAACNEERNRRTRTGRRQPPRHPSRAARPT